MATSTVISNFRPRHRTARASPEAFQGTLALDWANGAVIALSTTSLSVPAFDANNDRVVFCSVGVVSSVVGCTITVALAPTASSSAAGNMWIAQAEGPVPVYVPAGMTIAAVGQNAGTLFMLPALLASDP